MRRLCVLLLALAGCKSSNNVELRYHLLGGILPADVIRVDTLVNVDPADARRFYADQPFRQVATGVGYEVRDLDGSGRRSMRISFDATLGYHFRQTFHFALLPPAGETAPRLVLTATAMGQSTAISGAVMLPAVFGQSVDINLTDLRCGSQSCPADQACCNNSCVRTSNDVGNCGGCGTACGSGGDSCSGSTCRCAGGSACSNGKTCCGGLGCVDLQNDPFHCGSCNQSCNPGESCVAGVCKCGSAAACPNATVCCVNGISASCSMTGICVCGTTTCAPGDVCCGSSCANIRSDDTNCGSCGHVCRAPLHCSDGECACNGIVCTGSDSCCSTGCANLANDPANCGSCGHACGAGESCGPGPTGQPSCLCGSTVCPAGSSCCGSTCVDTSSNFNNCGACGHSCRQGEQCIGGACRCNSGPGCVGNQVCCGPATPGGGGCFDLANGPEHCGACDQGPCPVGQMCLQGMCVNSGCAPPCTHGNQCVGGQCRCNSGPACTGSLICCAAGCVDLKSDPNNCGSCAHSCAPDPFCCGGVCKPHSTMDCASCGNACSGGGDMAAAQMCCPPCTGGNWQCLNRCLPCL